MQHVQRQSLIGRERELEQLEGGLADARAGRGSLFLVTGVPGIGKTRLAEALSERADSRRDADGLGALLGEPGGARLLALDAGAARVIDRATSAALAAGARRRRGLDRRDRPGAARTHDRHRAARVAALGAGEVCAVRRGQHLPAQRQRERPAAVVLDDLHAADAESLALLDFMVRSLSEAPVVLVAAYQEAAARARPEVEKLFGALGVKGRHVALGGVDESDVGLIVAGGDRTAPPAELVQRAARDHRGQPVLRGRGGPAACRRGTARGLGTGRSPRPPSPSRHRPGDDLAPLRAARPAGGSTC